MQGGGEQSLSQSTKGWGWPCCTRLGGRPGPTSGTQLRFPFPGAHLFLIHLFLQTPEVSLQDTSGPRLESF